MPNTNKTSYQRGLYTASNINGNAPTFATSAMITQPYTELTIALSVCYISYHLLSSSTNTLFL